MKGQLDEAGGTIQELTAKPGPADIRPMELELLATALQKGAQNDATVRFNGWVMTSGRVEFDSCRDQAVPNVVLKSSKQPPSPLLNVYLAERFSEAAPTLKSKTVLVLGQVGVSPLSKTWVLIGAKVQLVE